MFNFLGTFSKAQFEMFQNWILAQVGDVDARVSHLKERCRRTGYLKMTFDTSGYPSSYTAMPSYSLMHKLITAYEATGGDLARDFRLRMWDQQVKLESAEGGSTQTSDGQVLQNRHMDDVQAAATVEQIRKSFIEPMKRKREFLEYRIKMTQDLYDQLNLEIVLLRVVKADPSGLDQVNGIDGEVDPVSKAIGEAKSNADLGQAFTDLVLHPQGSIQEAIKSVQMMMAEPDTYRSVQETTPYDIFGLKVQPLQAFGVKIDKLGEE